MKTEVKTTTTYHIPTTDLKELLGVYLAERGVNLDPANMDFNISSESDCWLSVKGVQIDMTNNIATK